MTDERYPDTPGLQTRLIDEIDAAGPIGVGLTKLTQSMSAYYQRDFLEAILHAILDRLVREGLISGGVGGCHYRTPRHERAHLLQIKADRIRWLIDEIDKQESHIRRLQASVPYLRGRLNVERAALDVLAAELYPDKAADVPTPTGSGAPHRGVKMEPEDGWRKSSFSGESGNCVEVKVVAGAFAIRDSKKPDDAPLLFTAAEWLAFTQGVRAGEFDE